MSGSPSAVLFLEEDLKELQLEPRSSAIKTHEELQKATIDEGLNLIDRALLIMNNGTEDQELSVIASLPELLQADRGDCLGKVVPRVQDVLHLAPPEMHLAASSTFLHILQKEIVPIENYTQTFLQTILLSVDSPDPEVAGAWLDTLLDVIELLPTDVLRTDVLTLAVSKGQLAQSVQSRMACCKILGKIATRMDSYVIKHDILPVVQSLCQDVDYEVRACMCRQLDSVARGLGLETTKSAILPELVELACDENVCVRLAGLETVGSIISLLDSDTRAVTIYPLVRNFCDQALTSNDYTLPVVARQFGKLCCGLADNLSLDQRLWLIDYFKELTTKGPCDWDKLSELAVDIDNNITDAYKADIRLLECRENAAYNFPAMTMFAGEDKFVSELYEAFSKLCSDASVNVRRNVASGFHEITAMVRDSVPGLQNDLITLLKDDSPEVLRGIVGHLPQILADLKPGSGGNHCEILAAILNCDQVVSSCNNWRLQAELLDKMAELHTVFSSEQIYGKIVPILILKMETARALPVKHAASRTLLKLLRYNHRLDQREEIWSKLVYDFCQGKSCYQRYLFIDICTMVIELYSKQFFKEYFFECFLEMSADRVANVRLRICRLLPQLKGLLKLPVDRHLLQKLEACVRRILINERDRDCEEAIRRAVEVLDRTQVMMESLIKPPYPDDILEDMRRQEDEKKLLEIEEKERRDDLKRKDGKSLAPRKSRIPAPTSKGSLPALKADNRRSSTGSVSSLRVPSGTNSVANRASSKPQISNKSSGNNNNVIGSPRPSIRSAGSVARTTTGGKTKLVGTSLPSPTATRRYSLPVNASIRRQSGSSETLKQEPPAPKTARDARRPSQP